MGPSSGLYILKAVFDEEVWSAFWMLLGHGFGVTGPIVDFIAAIPPFPKKRRKQVRNDVAGFSLQPPPLLHDPTLATSAFRGRLGCRSCILSLYPSHPTEPHICHGLSIASLRQLLTFTTSQTTWCMEALPETHLSFFSVWHGFSSYPGPLVARAGFPTGTSY